MAYGPTLRPEPTGLFCTDLPLCDTDTDRLGLGIIRLVYIELLSK